jgi:hypothetical protein
MYRYPFLFPATAGWVETTPEAAAQTMAAAARMTIGEGDTPPKGQAYHPSSRPIYAKTGCLPTAVWGQFSLDFRDSAQSG